MTIDYKKDIFPNQLFNQKGFLTQAIGLQLWEIERFFASKPQSFFEYYNNSKSEESYFSLNLGTTRFCFEGNLVHELQFFSANSPIITIPASFSSPYGGERYRLSQSGNLASIRLQNCLGKVCRDVRLWKFSETERFIRIDKAEGIWTPELAKEYSAEIKEEGEELTDSGISYLLSNGEEIIYCCNFYDDRLCDRLLLREQINLELVHSCYSLKQDCYLIEPQIKIHLYD